MDERAAVPVTLPKAGPTTSYWQDPPDSLADWQGYSCYEKEGHIPETSDTVIVGSGITGAGIAWNLLSQTPDRKIVMLEARQACSGATGRNGGHTKAASYRSFKDNAASLGTAEAVKIARFEYETIRSVHTHAREHSIQCDSWEGDTVDIIYDEGSWRTALESIEAMRRAMPDDLEGAAKYTVHNYEEARRRFQVKGESFCGAISYYAGSLSAYNFVIGVLKECIKSQSFQLFTHSPVTKIVRKPSGQQGWILETPRGEISAKEVVLATNGYTAAVLSAFQGKIVPLRGQITAHRPGTNLIRNPLNNTYSFIYPNGYEYMIPRPAGSRFEGDIVIGGGLTKAHEEGLFEFGTTDDTAVNSEISKYLTATTPRYFGPEGWGEDHPDGRIRREWNGIMGYSADGFPFVGRVPQSSSDDGAKEGLYVAASFQGHGMVLCWNVAKAVAMMLQGSTQEMHELHEWFPKAFVATEKRFATKFAGRLHTTAKAAVDVETQAMC